jgi:hypothetical protein
MLNTEDRNNIDKTLRHRDRRQQSKAMAVIMLVKVGVKEREGE